jgi:hypothetical protein
LTIPNRAEPVADRLEHIVEKGGIPAPYDRWGARLLGHLRRPVQIVVTGLPESGKTALIAMLSGQDVVGVHRSAPLIELSFGDRPRVLFEREDGSVETVAGLVKASDCPADVVRVRQEMPDPALKSQSYVEQGLSGDEEAMRAILDGIAKRADIVIWCSQDFSGIERRLWSEMPDRIKDHSFLVLTKADLLIRSGMLARHIEDLAPITADEFLGLYPVATLQGIAARPTSDGQSPDKWVASGGSHLSGALNKQIRQGRSADLDRAQIFLNRLGALVPDDPVNENEAPRPRTDRSRFEPGQDAIRHGETTVQSAPLAQPSPPNMADSVGAPDAETVSILSEAIDMLQEHGQKMLRQVDRMGDFDPDVILKNCTDAMSSLSRLLEKSDASDMMGREARESVEEGEEILMLFQLEQSQEAAIDAVTLLLQIRKDLIRKVAD